MRQNVGASCWFTSMATCKIKQWFSAYFSLPWKKIQKKWWLLLNFFSLVTIFLIQASIIKTLSRIWQQFPQVPRTCSQRSRSTLKTKGSASPHHRAMRGLPSPFSTSLTARPPLSSGKWQSTSISPPDSRSLWLMLPEATDWAYHQP